MFLIFPTVDLCATKKSTKCEAFYTKTDNYLEQEWSETILYLNPPFNEIDQALEKVYESIRAFNNTFLMILPMWEKNEMVWKSHFFHFSSYLNPTWIKQRRLYQHGKTSTIKEKAKLESYGSIDERGKDEIGPKTKFHQNQLISAQAKRQIALICNTHTEGKYN